MGTISLKTPVCLLYIIFVVNGNAKKNIGTGQTGSSWCLGCPNVSISMSASLSEDPDGDLHSITCCQRCLNKRLASLATNGKDGMHFIAEVSGNQAGVTRKPIVVKIYTAMKAYPTNTDVSFQAQVDETEPLEFVWYFGDSGPVKTTSRAISKRYHTPGRYNIVVVVSNGVSLFTSEVCPLVVQRTVRINRIVHQASVLLNQTTGLSCRVNTGTNLTYHWSFGDGTSVLGQNSVKHVFQRVGEFTVEVVVSNLVSSASLSNQIFVVDRPCQPPPVKNMGPLKIQVRRYEAVHLGVTYDTEVNCNISEGFSYSWTLYDCTGQPLLLHPIDTHKQTLMLPSHVLQYDIYTAIARVHIVGTVVYSNYTVRVEVVPASPVVLIQGGTNVFLKTTSITMITLDGQLSYDPDFPEDPLSYSWSCRPVSIVISSCFDQYVPASSAVLTFPASFLKANFDQFQFTLTVHSRGRSASSETFITVTPNLVKQVSVYYLQSQGDHINWNEAISVIAACVSCNGVPQYTWSIYMVNASSRPTVEVSFCHTVDTPAPSTIMRSFAEPASPSGTPTPKPLGVHPPPIPVRHLPVPPETSLPLSVESQSLESHPRKRKFPEPGAAVQSGKLASPTSVTSASSSPRSIEISGDSEPTEPPYFLSGVLTAASSGQSEVTTELDFDLMEESDVSFPLLESDSMGRHPDAEFDVPFPIEEGDPELSHGRIQVVDGESYASEHSLELDEDIGNNLMDFKTHSLTEQEPSLLDLPRQLIHRDLFRSYTETGISSPVLRFRPFSLQPGSKYLLEITARSHNALVGRTQLLLTTSPVPKGMACLVQPISGHEMHTHFSIFCTSGKEDLLYEFSFRVANGPLRTLYHGRDFQYYFNLPTGDPSDNYKVTVYTVIRSSHFGASTKPCPVTVQVYPSFLGNSSADLQLVQFGLANLSSLVRLGNSGDVRNYVSLLSAIVNRLSAQHGVANTPALTHMRRVLITTMCELDTSDRASLNDNLSILRDLLSVTHRVTLLSVREVVNYIQAISDRHLQLLDQETVKTLVILLSNGLKAVVTLRDLTPEASNSDDTSTPDAEGADGRAGSRSDDIEEDRVFTAERAVQLVKESMQTAADLLLKYVLFSETVDHRVSCGEVSLHASRHAQGAPPAAIGGGPAVVYLPRSLQPLLVGASVSRDACALSLLTVFTHSPYFWASTTIQLSGPVVDLSFYKCSTRREMPVHSLPQPVHIEIHQTTTHKSSDAQHVLLRSQVNYHQLNITQQHLQQAIHLRVVFARPPNKTFPIMLLFRMFDRPTPRDYHLYRVYQWKDNAMHISLPPSYLSAAGIGYLALLNADYAKVPRHKYVSSEVSYRLQLQTSLCLTWDGHQGKWTHHGCATQPGGTHNVVNCSCNRLKPVTVVQQHIQSRCETTDLIHFLSLASDLTLVCVLGVCVCVYALGLVACRRADAVSGESEKVHYLSDNCPSDRHLYAVSIHTGLHSAASMTAKVYIVLYGEEASSQTKELQSPECTLFKRNSRDTFILSTTESLGSLRGVHLWHDNAGSSPRWYLKHVEVTKVGQGGKMGNRWMFIAQCWLAVAKGDGQVERKLRVCDKPLGFAKLLSMKLCHYLAEFHLWAGVYCRPSPNPFTHTQRLSACLLLLLGYACASALLLSDVDEQAQVTFDLGFISVSPAAFTTGMLSVLAVLPIATLISFLFRLREVKPKASRVQRPRSSEENVLTCKTGGDLVTKANRMTGGRQNLAMPCEPVTDRLPGNQVNHSAKDPEAQIDAVASAPSLWEDKPLASEEGFRSSLMDRILLGNKVADVNHGCQAGSLDPDTGRHDDDDNDSHRGVVGRWFRRTSHYLGWLLFLMLGLSCLALSVVLGIRFSSSKALLWCHSVIFSMLMCAVLIQPATIVLVAVGVSFWYRNSPGFHCFSGVTRFEVEEFKLDTAVGHSSVHLDDLPIFLLDHPQQRSSYVEKLLEARQRSRYLRLARPPSSAELSIARVARRKESLVNKTLRELCFFVSMLLLLLGTASQGSEHYRLNTAARMHFTRDSRYPFYSIRSLGDWWTWTETSLLDVLYRNTSATNEAGMQGRNFMIGEPLLWKTDVSDMPHCQVSNGINSILPECPPIDQFGDRVSTDLTSAAALSVATNPQMCRHSSCRSGSSASVGLGLTRTQAVSRLRSLRSDSGTGSRMGALRVQITLYSPAANLFTSVTLQAEQSTSGIWLPSAHAQSAWVHPVHSVWNCVNVACQILFVLLSLLQFCSQVYCAGQQGLMGYCRSPCNWLEVGVRVGFLVHCVYYLCNAVSSLQVADLLQRPGYKGHVDVCTLAVCQQHVRTLRGFVLFLVSVKCLLVLRVNRSVAVCTTVLVRSLSSLFWPMVSGVILLVALSCLGNLLFIQNSWAFSSLPHAVQTLMPRYGGPRALFLSGWRGSSPGLSEIFYHGVFRVTSTVVWTSLVIGVLSALVKAVKRASQRRRDAITLSDIAVHIRDKVYLLIGQATPKLTKNHARGNYYLEEFESLVDELLFRLNALSNSLHKTLPLKSSVASLGNPSRPDTQCSNVSVTTHMTDETEMNEYANIKEDSPRAHQLRSQLDVDTLGFQQERGDSLFIDQNVVFDGEHAQDCQTFLRGQSSLSLTKLESSTGTCNRVGHLVPNVVNQSIQLDLTRTDYQSCSTRTYKDIAISNNSCPHTAIEVKAMVHNIPNSRDVK